MTREMHKPDWDMKHRQEKEQQQPRKRILNPLIEEFFWNCCKFEKVGNNVASK